MKKYLLMCLLCISSLGHARILFVPDSLQTIRMAIDSSSAGDTILLSRDTYFDTVSITHPITISSNFLFDHDSTSIRETAWKAFYSRSLIYLSNTSLNVIGIHFTSLGDGVQARNVVTAASSQVTLVDCRFSGTFTQLVYPNDATMILTGVSSLKAMRCGISGDRNGSLWLRTENSCRDVRINNSWFISQGERSSIAPVIYSIADTVRIDSCTFSGRSRIMWLYSRQFAITNCIMEGFNADALRLVGGNTTIQSKFTGNILRNSVITDMNSCVFSIPCSFTSANSYLIENCTFENIMQAPDVQHAELIYSTTINPIIMRKCSFINNQIHTNAMIIMNPFSTIDSCQFIRNTATPFFERPGTTWPVNFRYCDFIDNTGIINFNSVDSVRAPDCYWGSETGPRCALNPSGTGQAVVAYLNPFPFRRTPVFPDTRVEEPVRLEGPHPQSTQLLDGYPNPFNATTTLKYTVAKSAKIELAVFDITGREVGKIVDFHQNPGEYSVKFDGTKLATGTYFVRLKADNFVQTQKMVLLK